MIPPNSNPSHSAKPISEPDMGFSFTCDEKGRGSMAVRFNEDKEMVASIKEGLKRTGGYCPCRLERTEDNKCICKEFREQIADPDFKGYCHCLLYYKD